MIAFHCDCVGCDTWSPDRKLFILVKKYGGPDYHYCCKWCMVVEESKSVEPTEEVGL